MKNSREIVMKAGVLPKLRLGIKQGNSVKPTGPHKVKLLEDKIVQKLDAELKPTHYMRFIVEENGEKKQYDCRVKSKDGTDPHYLVQALAEVKEGEEIQLEMKKAGVKSYIEVIRLSDGQQLAGKDDVNDDDRDDDEDQTDGLVEDLKTIHA